MRLSDLRQGDKQKRTARRLAPELTCLEGRALLSTVPTTTANVMGPLGANGYYTGPVTVKLSANEPNVSSSSLTTEYSINGGQFTPGNQIFLDHNGVDQIQFFSSDQNGNIGPTDSLTIRIDRTPPMLTVSANPTTLWPPNHKFDTVHVSGMAGDPNSGVEGSKVFYFVKDEYGQVQPSGFARINSDGRYSFDVQLQASRTGQDHDGRQYTIFVVARNGAGEVAFKSVTVTVPHDQGHPVNSGGNQSGDDNDQGDEWGGGGMGGDENDQGDQGDNQGGQGNNGHGNGRKNGHGNGHGHGHGHG